MTSADEIASIFQVLFDGEHPLLETVIFWAEKLRDCQRRVLHVDGTLGGSLEHILETFHFAPQRSESFRRPLFQVICLLVPIVMMLTEMAEDGDKFARFRAEKVLSALDFAFIVNMGVSCDYAEIGL